MDTEEYARKAAAAHNESLSGTLMENLGMRYTYVGEGRVEATMPIDKRTMQPFGVLHGGASIALAETVAGLGSRVLCDEKHIAVGMQVSANHISTADCSEEYVSAEATMIHKGGRTHIWNIDIRTRSGRLVSTVRVVNFIVAKA